MTQPGAFDEAFDDSVAAVIHVVGIIVALFLCGLWIYLDQAGLVKFTIQDTPGEGHLVDCSRVWSPVALIIGPFQTCSDLTQTASLTYYKALSNTGACCSAASLYILFTLTLNRTQQECETLRVHVLCDGYAGP